MQNFTTYKIFVVALFLLSLPWVLLAANSVITGSVIDSQTNEPLPGANVYILGTGIGAASNMEGKFYISNVPPGRHLLVVDYIGYKQQKVEVEILPQQRMKNLIFKLEYAAFEIDKAIVVTAQAEGQIEAINKQLAARSIVNVVSSARIQEIPDANAAESIARLPGVSVTRSGGEGTHITIRGLSPKFNTIQINDVKMASTEGGERSVNLSMISPYMLEGIEVMKALTADQDADAMGGTVGFKIKKAKTGFHRDIIFQGGYNQLRNTYHDYKIVGDVSNRFFKDRLGIFAQLDIENRNRSSQSIGAGYSTPAIIPGQVNKIEINSLNHSDIIRDKQRLGGTFVVDYNIPNGNISLTNFLSHAITNGTQYYDNFDFISRFRHLGGNDGENKLSAITNVLEYGQNFGPLKVNTNLSYTFSENHSPENISWDAEESQAFSSNLNLQAHPTKFYQYAKNDIMNTTLRAVNSSLYYNKEYAVALKTDFQYQLNLSKKLSSTLMFGGKHRYQDRHYDYQFITAPQDGFRFPHSAEFKREIWHLLIGGPSENDNYTAFPFHYFIGNYQVENFLQNDYQFGPTADKDLMWKVARLSTLNGKGEEHVMVSTIDDYSGIERASAGYFMTDFKYGTAIQFIPGIRYENVYTEYNGVSGDSRSGWGSSAYPHVPTISKRRNEFWLPQIHLRLKPFSWFDVRLAYTNSLNRPSYNWLVPTQDISTKWIRMNNLGLKPARSQNYDLYLSTYENYIGLFTIGGFYKKIHDFIYQNSYFVIDNPAAYNLPSFTKGFFTSFPVNNQEIVDLWGIELDWQTNFWYLPGLLRGMVLNINYTHIFSESTYPRTITNTEWIVDQWGFPAQKIIYEYSTYRDRLIDQPDDIANVVLGYDLGGFSARLSLLYQTDIFQQTAFLPEMRMSTDDYWRWDFSIKQELPVRGLQVFMNVNNISATHDRTLIRGTGFPTSDDFYGMTLDLGLRYRL
ncbi:carboxypeptidase-like regulatory domain-containing protein [candidate division KSB1 bacterium]|nr:carboxypeptidase-like regulatory domain-containing protein [candidate division KSB1 bacterium]